MNKRLWLVLAILVLSALLLPACNPQDEPVASSSPEETPECDPVTVQWLVYHTDVVLHEESVTYVPSEPYEIKDYDWGETAWYVDWQVYDMGLVAALDDRVESDPRYVAVNENLSNFWPDGPQLFRYDNDFFAGYAEITEFAGYCPDPIQVYVDIYSDENELDRCEDGFCYSPDWDSESAIYFNIGPEDLGPEVVWNPAGFERITSADLLADYQNSQDTVIGTFTIVWGTSEGEQVADMLVNLPYTIVYSPGYDDSGVRSTGIIVYKADE